MPSTLHESVKGSPPMSSFEVAFLLRVSQKRTVPSAAQLASSNSRTGLKSTFSTVKVWPFNSVWARELVLSGFQTRIVLSEAPVATSPPEAFQDMVLCLLPESAL